MRFLTNREEIAAAQGRFQNQLEGAATEFVEIKVGFHGGHRSLRVGWIAAHDMWFGSDPGLGRWWNPLGLGKPQAGRNYAIVTQINSPLEGRNRRITGGYVADGDRTLVVHNGQVVSQNRRVTVPLGARRSVEIDGGQYVVIGALGDPSLPAHVAAFVREVKRFKEEARIGDDEALLDEEEDVPLEEGTPGAFWKLSPGHNGVDWPKWRDGGYGAIGWRRLGDLSGLDRDGFDERVRQLSNEDPRWTKAGMEQVWRFKSIKPGARIVANDGTRRVLGIGTVTGLYQFVPTDQESPHHLPVTWDDTQERKVERLGWRKTLIQLSAEDFQAILAAPREGTRSTEPEPEAPPKVLAFDDIVAALENQGLSFPEELVAAYLLALQTKRFVILSGISGTGKTRLATGIAEIFRRRRGGCLLVAVRPDWTDGRGLLGFYNPITEAYQSTPFLDLLLAAGAEQTRAREQGRPPDPSFVVLDEMNLARVEHYFSDFLSCMESGHPVALHDSAPVEERQGIPRALTVPSNLFFTGTVNVDETTYMFSPKVLDRAFTLEFNQVDLAAYGQEADDEPTPATSGLARPFELYQFAGSLELSNGPGRDDWLELSKLDSGLARTLIDLNALLAPEHRHFGYRVANEIARFVSLGSRQAGGNLETLWAALDIAVLAKVMPKLHGTQQEMEALLKRLFSYAVTGDVAGVADEGTWQLAGAELAASPDHAPPRLPRTAAKLWHMLRRLRQQGFTSFIE